MVLLFIGVLVLGINSAEFTPVVEDLPLEDIALETIIDDEGNLVNE